LRHKVFPRERINPKQEFTMHYWVLKVPDSGWIYAVDLLDGLVPHNGDEILGDFNTFEESQAFLVSL
jgi:hypothetical protein